MLEPRDEQLTFDGFAAAMWADRLRSFYESLTGVRGPVLGPPCMRQRPFNIAGP
jgi:hypothetical protein